MSDGHSECGYHQKAHFPERRIGTGEMTVEYTPPVHDLKTTIFLAKIH